jgi:hypothetical protein
MQRRSFIKRIITTFVAAEGVPAYGRSDPRIPLPAGGTRTPLSLARAAILASNAHNAQPWLFKVSDSRIELYADARRNLGAVDPYLREMHLSLGCALENLVIAAAPNGYRSSVTVFPADLARLPDHWQSRPVAVVELAAARQSMSELYEAIPNRHTNRGLYDPEKPPPSTFVRTLENLSKDTEARMVLFTSNQARERIANLTEASSLIYRDPAVAHDLKSWARTTEEQLGRFRDGFLAIPDPATKDMSHANLMLRAPLFGMIAVRDRYERKQALCAGRLWQRAHLLATTHGLAARPDNGAVELADYQRRLNLPPVATAQLSELIGDEKWQPTLVFYMGYALSPPEASLRRPIADVLLTADA